jgi:hypothetical protein
MIGQRAAGEYGCDQLCMSRADSSSGKYVAPVLSEQRITVAARIALGLTGDVANQQLAFLLGQLGSRFEGLVELDQYGTNVAIKAGLVVGARKRRRQSDPFLPSATRDEAKGRSWLAATVAKMTALLLSFVITVAAPFSALVAAFFTT